jgi:hypothetical protein
MLNTACRLERDPYHDERVAIAAAIGTR